MDKREQRRLIRRKGTLCCEWCNRWTEVRPGFRWSEVPLRVWKTFRDRNAVFYCKRPKCRLASREMRA